MLVLSAPEEDWLLVLFWYELSDVCDFFCGVCTPPSPLAAVVAKPAAFLNVLLFEGRS
jgi:hypothetical protein